MITIVVTEHGRVKGYLIDDIYVKKESMKYFTSQKVFRGIRVIGKTVSTGVKIRNKLYKNVFNFLNTRDYEKVIRVFTINAIPLYDILFVKCNPLFYDSDIVSEIWYIFGDLACRKLNYYICVRNNGNICAYLVTSADIYKSEITYIHMIETLEKRTGVGTSIVEQLKIFGKSVKGLAIRTSFGFWQKQGAKFTEDNHFTV